MHETHTLPNQSEALARGRRLEYATVSWNVVEAGVSIFAGLAAGSPALLGFGIDAVIESLSGSVLLWRLQDDGDHETRERRSLALVGWSFFLLSIWVAYESLNALLTQEAPSASRAGMIIAALSLLVMPWLARKKRKVAGDLHSHALESDSRQTDLCAYLSAILLVGLGLNAWLGWWWADPVAGLCMVPIIAREGVTALRGRRCATC